MRITVGIASLALLLANAFCCCATTSSVPDPPSSTPAIVESIDDVLPYGDTSYDNPAPPGTSVTINQLVISVYESLRPADARIKQDNTVNPQAGEGMEYVLVSVMIQCKKGQSDTCRVNPRDFRLVGSHAIIYKPQMTVVHDDDLDSMEIYSGSKTSGDICFKVHKGDEDLRLVYESDLFLQDEKKAFMDLPD